MCVLSGLYLMAGARPPIIALDCVVKPTSGRGGHKLHMWKRARLPAHWFSEADPPSLRGNVAHAIAIGDGWSKRLRPEDSEHAMSMGAPRRTSHLALSDEDIRWIARMLLRDEAAGSALVYTPEAVHARTIAPAAAGVPADAWICKSRPRAWL